MTPLPATSFAQLATELTIIARDKAMAAEASEIMVATVEARGAADLGVAIKHSGMRSSVAMLKHRAALAGQAADVMRALAGSEAAIRALVTAETTMNGGLT